MTLLVLSLVGLYVVVGTLCLALCRVAADSQREEVER